MLRQLVMPGGQVIVVSPVNVVVSSVEFCVLVRPEDCGHDAVFAPVVPVIVQFPAGALAMGAPRLVVSTPEEARESLWVMVLLMIFTFNASCNEIPAPSQPARLFAMMLLVIVTSCQCCGWVANVATSVPLTCCRRMPPPLPLSAELPWIRLALISKPGPVPSLNPGGQSVSGTPGQTGSVSGVPMTWMAPPLVGIVGLLLWLNAKVLCSMSPLKISPR